MTGADADLRRRAEDWIAGDVDPAAQDELRALLAAPDLAATDLADRFAGPLAFGTAGLRGVMGAGPNRMNRAVVARTTWALAETLREEAANRAGGAAQGVPHVVVGADARRNSDVFVEDVAAILAGAGLRVTLFREPVPTPLVAFAVKHLGAAAGVVVTASHNTPEYNGYKVYGGDGAQVAPPLDERIARALDLAPPARVIARAVLGPAVLGPAVEAARDAGPIAFVGDDLANAYVAAIRFASNRIGKRDLHDAGNRKDRTIPIVYTPLHGVGHRLMSRVLREAGFTAVTTVPEQEQPDGAFPTVAFPNPEEPGAMDRALALAASRGARLVLANDPDADRLAVAVARPEQGLRMLTGNEVGILLGHALLSAAGSADSARGAKSAVVTSIVSSPCLGVIAVDLGARYEETLTGFKWIERRTIELEHEGYDVLLGYEEALGYCVGNAVRDKDGIAAGLVVAELAASLAAEGRTLLDALDAIAERWGVFASRQMSVAKSPTMMRALRAAPPVRIGREPVVAVTDYIGGDRLPPSDVLAFHLASGGRIVVRPSGTEPKAKFYFDVRVPVTANTTTATLDAARAHAEGCLSGLMEAMKSILAALPGA
jgi:phosphomannomutase